MLEGFAAYQLKLSSAPPVTGALGVIGLSGRASFQGKAMVVDKRLILHYIKLSPAGGRGDVYEAQLNSKRQQGKTVDAREKTIDKDGAEVNRLTGEDISESDIKEAIDAALT